VKTEASNLERPSALEPERLADQVVVALEVEGQNNLLLSEGPVG
jgi:hypothetical protein